MADSGLVKKLKLSPGARAAIVGAPPGYLASLKLPSGVKVSKQVSGRYNWIQLFVKTRAELEAKIGRIAKALSPDGLLWISFPKGSSGIQTDLTRDKGWDSLKKVDLKWITLISVDDEWSAFSLRPYKPGEARQSFR